MEARNLLELQPMKFNGIIPAKLQTITIDGFILKDTAFINKAGLFSQHLAKTESSGVLNVNNFTLQLSYFNNSLGLFNFWTIQQVVVKSSAFLQNRINATYLFWLNTIDISDVTMQNCTFTVGGRFISTQPQAPESIPISSDLNGLAFSISRIRFADILCLSMNCLIYTFTPVNPYLLRMNVTINEIEIANTQSQGFDPAWMPSANAAMLFF